MAIVEGVVEGKGYSQDAYDKYSETEQGASVKASGGNYGGGYGDNRDTVGALCARDYKGIGNQYVSEGKCIVCDSGSSDTEN